MSANDPRYADINNGRAYPPLTREQSYRAALKLLRVFGHPRDAAQRPALSTNSEKRWRFARRDELMAIFRRYLQDTRQLGSSKGLGRRCWAATKPTCGHSKGWGRLIHDVSHMVHEYRFPHDKPHDETHHRIEREVQAYVDSTQMPADYARRKPKRTSVEKRQLKLASVHMRIRRWESKAKRAETALRKLRRQQRQLEKAVPGRMSEVFGGECTGTVMVVR